MYFLNMFEKCEFWIGMFCERNFGAESIVVYSGSDL